MHLLCIPKFFKLKTGFTLAEILITLLIIGVIAAMTLPTLSHFLKGKILQTQFNKTYADLNAAAKSFYVNEGVSVSSYSTHYTGNSGSSDQLLKQFMFYFEGITESTELRWHYFDKNRNIKNLNLNGKELPYINKSYPCDTSRVTIDKAGRLYAMDNPPNYYKYIWNENFSFGPKICVDINGIKTPNQWGVDRFVFVFTEDNRVEPYTGANLYNLSPQLTDEKEIVKYCSYSQTTPAHTCAYFAAKNRSPEGKGNYWSDFL